SCCCAALVAVAAPSNATAATAVDRFVSVFQRVMGFSFDSADVRYLDLGLRDLPFALADKREQVAVDEIGMRGGQAVRQARIVDFDSTGDQPGRLLPRVFDRHDLVVLTVLDQSRDVELPQVFREIS